MLIDLPGGALEARRDQLPRSLRVLTVAIDYAPASSTTELCEHLAARGMSVSVFTLAPRSGRIHGVDVRRLRQHVLRRRSALRRAADEVGFGAQVAVQRPPERPAVVLAVVPSWAGALAAARVARRAGAPLVVWVQAPAQNGVVGAVERALLRRADRVVVANEQFHEHALAVGVPAERLVVQPNWTRLLPVPLADRARIRARLGWADETVVLHTGNMGLKQDLENVVDAGRWAVAQGRHDVRFVLIGDGSQRELLAERAAGLATVELRPPAAPDEYAEVLAAADVLLVNERPSDVDTCPPSELASYLHAGQPVVAASPGGGGTAAEVRRSGAGVVVEPGDPEALLAAVRDLAADPAGMAALGRAGKAYAAAHLGADDARDSLADVLRQVVSAHRG